MKTYSKINRARFWPASNVGFLMLINGNTKNGEAMMTKGETWHQRDI
jgi:hypothetical protein